MSLLLLNNFYPVISCRRVRKERDGLSYTVWSLVMVRNQFPALLPRREFFVPKIATFPQFQVYLSITHAEIMNNKFLQCDIVPTCSKGKRRFGRSLWSAISCQPVKNLSRLADLRVSLQVLQPVYSRCFQCCIQFQEHADTREPRRIINIDCAEGFAPFLSTPRIQITYIARACFLRVHSTSSRFNEACRRLYIL